MLNRKKIKLQNYCKDVLKAAYYYKHQAFDEARLYFRRSGEAFMKYLFYDHCDETKVANYLVGSHLLDGTVKRKRWRPSYSDMLRDLQGLNCLNEVELFSLSQLPADANQSMHDSDAEEAEPTELAESDTEVDVNFVHACSQKLTNSLYKRMHREVPQQLTDAYQGKVDSRVVQDCHDFSDLLNVVENFDDRNQYILVSPPNDEHTTVQLKASLSRVPWSFIIDFDSETKGKYGLFTAFHAATDSRVVPLSIEQYDAHVALPVSTNGSRLNWLFANGLSGNTDTVCPNFRVWNKRKYGKFIKGALKHFTTDLTRVYYIVSLGVDERYVKDIIHSLSDIDELQPDLVNFVFVSTDEEYLDSVSEEAKQYGYDNSYVFNMDTNEFIMGIEESMSSTCNTLLSSVLVPSRVTGKMQLEDLSSIVSNLKDGGLEIVHSTIGMNAVSDLSPSETFYRGEDITWHEISQNVEADRKIYELLVNKVKDRMLLRQSAKFMLYHAAGAGGTTLSRKLAYALKKDYPVIILSKYVKNVTEEKLNIFYNKVKTPVIVIVEASKVNITTIDALIRSCNYSKQIFQFVVVERHKREKTFSTNQPGKIYLSETMGDTDEKNRFVSKVELFGKKTSPKIDWDKRAPNQCEVIDFSLAISADNYKQEKLEEYVKYYNELLSQPLNDFVLYVSMIYHYSQKEVSDLFFRNLFQKNGEVIGLSRYLRSHHAEELALSKILNKVVDESTRQTLWRPRYARFADAVLEAACTVGGWKEIAYETSINLIKCIKSNQEYLMDDSRQILISVFLERGKEDLLGVEEAWAKDNNTHFSQLLEDLGYSDRNQRNVLMRLATSYPSEAHFWGHLARFCYEKASTPKDFEEAMQYVKKAFDANGESDFNLQHIAGMCKRRLLEYYKREDVHLDFDEIKELIEEARGYFQESRRLNAKNIYAYISEIQLIVILIEYGKSLSKYPTYKQFLFSRENEWYQEQYVSMLELIDETKILLSQMKTLGNTLRTHKSFDYLNKSESQTLNFVDDLSGMLSHLSAAIETALYEERPRLRQLYVRYLLLSKVKGDVKRLGEAWGMLSTKEQAKVESYLNSNIQQGNASIFSLRYWFQFIRKCRKDTPIDEILSRMEMLAQSSSAHPLVQLEANYNILTLKAFSIIQDQDYFDTNKIKEIKELAEWCHTQSVNDKYIFDLLVHTNDISGIEPYKDNTDFSHCVRLHGTISSIRSLAQGEIKLHCGLTAFFAPSKANLIGGQDETKEVTFVIGFRHDGLFALEVALVGEPENATSTQIADELAEENKIEDIEDGIPSEASETDKGIELYEIPETKKQEFKILGKIQL